MFVFGCTMGFRMSEKSFPNQDIRNIPTVFYREKAAHLRSKFMGPYQKINLAGKLLFVQL